VDWDRADSGCPAADSNVSGRPQILSDIETAVCDAPSLWWLGAGGFVLKYREAILYIDPNLSEPGALFEAADVTHAGLVLCTNRARLNPVTIPALLAASPRAKLVLPKSLAAHAQQLGIPFSRMVTTDSNLRVEYLDDRIYAVPSALSEAGLEWTPIGGYPNLGYLVRFGDVTIYHAGDSIPYEGLAGRLRPYSVTVALAPIGGRPCNFEPAEAAQLAADIGARWLVPMSYRPEHVERFIEHMLGARPDQHFKIFQPGERWTVPRA
jgi:L-ascorbate 6-phosphate lactonase